MAVMEFLTKNKLNTTTMLTVDTSTDTAQYIFDRSTTLPYQTSNYNSTTAAVVTISFSAATIVSHVMLQAHNLKEFSVYYNNTTTNSLFSTTTNSASSTYISFASITVSAISVRMVASIAAGEEKTIGELFIGERRLQFERNPSHENWSPAIDPEQIVHRMPDGGDTVFHVRKQFNAKLSWEFITEDFRDDLFAVYRTGYAFTFVPHPTATGWDGSAYEVNWMDAFDFIPSHDVESSGYSGSIKMEKTSSG